MENPTEDERQGKNLFMETEDEAEERNGEPESTTEFEEPINPELEELVTRDCGPLLVVRRAYFAPKEMERDAWLRNNIFQSTSTIDSKVCRFVIDLGSYENVISEEDVQKLGLKTE